MSNIEENLGFILSSRYGKDVRQAIHDAIHDCYEDGKAGSVDLVAREQIADTDEKLSAQIANLVANAPSGSEKDSELVDIRVGYDGTRYTSAGEAVRKQFSSLSEDIDVFYNSSELVIGINKFNKETATNGYYMTSEGVKTSQASLFITDYIPVKGGEKLEVSYGDTSNRKKGAVRMTCVFDENQDVIAGGVNSEVSYFTVPDGASFVILTLRVEYGIDTIVVYDSNVSNSLEYFAYDEQRDFSKSCYQILNRLDRLEGNIDLIVDAKGKGDYTSINEALENANDSTDNHITILIMPGIYVESINLVARNITLIGLNRDLCIIKTYTNDYLNPPLDIWVNSNVYNLSFIADRNETTPEEGAGNGRAYGVHVDQNSRVKSLTDLGLDTSEYEGTCIIDNCYIESKFVNGLGGGTCPNCTIIFRNCEMASDSDEWSGYRMHSYPYSGGNQKCVTENCKMHNKGAYSPISVQDNNQYSGGTYDVEDTVFTFIQNVAWNEAEGVKTRITGLVGTEGTSEGCIDGKIILGNASFGNNIDSLNYK